MTKRDRNPRRTAALLASTQLRGEHRQSCPAFALLAALITSTSPAAAERLVSSLSNHRVMVTSNFTGDEVVLFGGIEQDANSRPRRGGYDIVVTVTGPRQTLVTFRKSRVLGIWVNTDWQRIREGAGLPCGAAAIGRSTTLPAPRRCSGCSLAWTIFRCLNAAMQVTPTASSDDPFRAAFLKIRTDLGLYREVSNGVTFLTPALFRASIPLPAAVPVGNYEVDVRLFADGAMIARTPSALEVYKAGFEQVVSNAARYHGFLYGARHRDDGDRHRLVRERGVPAGLKRRRRVDAQFGQSLKQCVAAKA